MSKFEFSAISDPTHFYPIREGATFVCEACCGNGKLGLVDGCVIFHCPDHMTICIKDGEVLSFESHGVRQ